MDGKDVEKRESSYTVGGNVTWCSHCGEQYGDFLKELIIELAYYTAIPVLSIYPEKMIIEKDKSTNSSLEHTEGNTVIQTLEMTLYQ